jgi:hypothetical protein
VRHLHEGGARQPSYNWGFLLLLALCVEFWIIVTTAIAENL